MYNIHFSDTPSNTIRTLSRILECKSFSKVLYQSPGDRHAYSNKFYIFQEKCYKTIDKIDFTQKEFDRMINVMFSTMMYLCFSIGRLPGQMKDFYKYIRF